MDIYSNILYVKEEYAALSALAHRCAAADKYRPETCCVAGNYYSLRWVLAVREWVVAELGHNTRLSELVLGWDAQLQGGS
jgi:hypothetical protein